MRYDGYTGQVSIEGDTLTITREGMGGRMAFGKREPRTVPLQAISDVRLIDATPLKNGYLALGLSGFPAPDLSRPDAVSHIDAVVFTHKQRKAFTELFGIIRGVVEQNTAAGVDPTAYEATGGSSSRIDEKLEKKNRRREELTAQFAAMRAAQEERGVLFVGTSHESGRNATVTLYADRIERVKQAAFTAISNARQDVEMTPIRSVSSVQAQKDGVAYAKVTVFASGNNIEFRFTHAEASRFRDEIQKLLLAGPTPSVIQPDAPDISDQLIKLAGLRDAGILTEEEFAAQKTKLLDP